MRVAVTGASGFVGRHLVGRLLDAGHEVRALSHRTAIPVSDGLEVVPGSLDDSAALTRLMAETDAVVHLAGLVAARVSDEFHTVNADGTRRVADAAAAAGVDRLLFLSSLAARRPDLSAYAASKRAGEQVLADRTDLAWDALRPPAIYGPGDRQVLIFFRLLKRRIGLLPAGARARVSLIHVDDLCAAILAWLAGPAPSGEIYELADGQREGYTWHALIDAAARELTVQPHYVKPPTAALRIAGHLAAAWGRLSGRTQFLGPGKVRELCQADWVCRDDRFRRVTGWRPQVQLGEGLRETVTWYRAHGWL